MNKKQWREKIEKMRSEESDFCALHWGARDWNAWRTDRLTRDQQALLAACAEQGIVPMPGHRTPDTISFSGLKNAR